MWEQFQEMETEKAGWVETTQAQSVGLLGLDHKLSLCPVVSHCPGVTWPQGRFRFLRVTSIFHKLEGRAKAAAVRLGWGRCEAWAGCPGEMPSSVLPETQPDLALTLGSFWRRVCGTVPGRAATSIGLDVYKLIRPQLRKHITRDTKARSSFRSKWQSSNVPFLFVSFWNTRVNGSIFLRDHICSSWGPRFLFPQGTLTRVCPLQQWHLQAERGETYIQARPWNPSSTELLTALSLWGFCFITKPSKKCLSEHHYNLLYQVLPLRITERVLQTLSWLSILTGRR